MNTVEEVTRRISQIKSLLRSIQNAQTLRNGWFNSIQNIELEINNIKQDYKNVHFELSDSAFASFRKMSKQECRLINELENVELSVIVIELYLQNIQQKDLNIPNIVNDLDTDLNNIGRILKYQSELTDKTDAFTQFVFERNRKINFLAKREDSIVKIGLLLNDFAVYMYNFATKQCEQVMSIPIAAAQIIHDGLKIGLRHDSKEIVFTANSASIAEEWSKLFREKQPSLVVRPQTPVAPRKPPLRRSTHLSGGADAAKRTRRLSLPCWAAQLESAQHTPPFVERPEARAHVLVVHTAPEWARELSLPKRAWRGSGSCSSAASTPSLPKQKKHTLSFDDAEGHVGKSLSFAESTGQTPRLPPTPCQKAPQQPRRNSVDPAPPTPERQTGLLSARHPPMHASKSQTIAIPGTLLPHPLQTAHEPAADDKGKKLKLVKDWTASKLDQITAFLSGLEKASTDSATLARNFKLAKEIQSAFIPAEKYVSVPPPPLPKQMCVDEMKIKFALITMEIRLIKVVSNIKSALVKVTLEERDALNVIVECTRKAFGFLPK